MRKPIFRAWDEKEKLMLNPKQTDRIDTPLKYWEENPKVILMQKTGLKDFKGHEIFEGDIIKHPNGETATILWDKIHAGFRASYINPVGNEAIFLQVNDKGCAVVVGNILENPDLLINA